MNWFLYDKDFRHERVKTIISLQTTLEKILKITTANDKISCNETKMNLVFVVRKAQRIFKISHIWSFLTLCLTENQFIVA